MAQKTVYQDLDVKGSVVASRIVNPNKPANHLLRADGEVQDPNVFKQYEVVDVLPATGLFEGREVMYQGQKYVYSTFYRSWVVAFDVRTEPVYNSMKDRGFYEILGYNYSLYQNTINRSYLSKYINYCNYTDDFLIETSVDNETFTELDKTNKAYHIFNPTNNGPWNVANYSSIRLTVGYGKINLVIKSFYINHVSIGIKKIKIDHQLRSDLSWEEFGEVDFTSVNSNNKTIWVSLDMFSKPLGTYGSIYKLRFTLEIDVLSPTNNGIINIFLIGEGSKYLAGINNYFNLSYKLLDCYSTIDYPITLNYDVANIEPTQTGEVEKKANWVIRYLLQAVNWLKKNYLPASALDAKTISDFSDLSASQVDYFVDSTLTDSIFNQKVTFPGDWKGRKICLSLSPVVFQKDYEYSLKVMFANYMKATGARLFIENDLASMVGVSTLIKILIDNNVIIVEAYIEA